MTYLKPEGLSSGGGSVKTTERPVSRRMAWLRGGLSIYILFHVSCMLLVPNSDNYTGSVLFRFVKPYVFFLELTNHWNFFSPNPEPPVYVDYQLEDAQGVGYYDGRWPDTQERFFWKDRHMRRITAADFMVNQEVGAEKMMVNYLCHKTPRPHSVRIWRVMEAVPRVDEVVSGARKLGDGKISERKFVAHVFCEGSDS